MGGDADSGGRKHAGGSRMTRVVVGMSGGVDSSVAAWLLKQEGYEVTGVTLNLWEETAASAVQDAAAVAEVLGIPHRVVDFREIFRRDVISYFTEEYARGRTPNPCVRCNPLVKWEALGCVMRETGADFAATGHYARVRHLADGRWALARAQTGKDQTYALYRLSQEQLSHTLLPLGKYTKPQVRQMAREAGIPVFDKPDSQEICFIPDHDYAAFIERTGARDFPEGNFVSRTGEVLGRHRGLVHYTVGQRKGLGLSFGKPMYVLEIRPRTNEVVLGGEDEVWSSRLICGDLHFQALPELNEERTVTAKIRYSHGGAPCRLIPLPEGRAECRFPEPVRAVTPGQAVVFYDGDLVLGGGTIFPDTTTT